MKTILIIGLVSFVLFLLLPASCLPWLADASEESFSHLVSEQSRPTQPNLMGSEPEESPARTALARQKEVFAQVIRRFQEEGANLKAVLEEGRESLLNFRSSIREARDQDTEFNRVYGSWEEVERKTAALKNQFEKLVEGAAEFYATAEEHAASIQDEALRTESLAYIKQSRDSYLERLELAKEAIQEVDMVKVAVDDTMKALEIRFAVDIIDQRLVEIFEQIDAMVDEVLKALEELDIQSQEVLGSFE